MIKLIAIFGALTAVVAKVAVWAGLAKFIKGLFK